MAELARYALPGIIVLTSVGAFFMCLLVIRYGFSGQIQEDLDEEAAHRLLMTRFGHAVAAVCFAGAALLAIIALGPGATSRSAPVAQAVVPAAPQNTAALDQQAKEIDQLRDSLHRMQLEIDEKLTVVENRVGELANRAQVDASTLPGRPEPAGGERVVRSAPSRSGNTTVPTRSGNTTAVARRSDTEDVAALPASATAHQYRVRVQGVSVDVQTRTVRDNETAYIVRLLDPGDRPLKGADVTLVGSRSDGSPIFATLEATGEPGVHRARVATPGQGADLRLRIVGPGTRFEVSLAREVNW